MILLNPGNAVLSSLTGSVISFMCFSFGGWLK